MIGVENLFNIITNAQNRQCTKIVNNMHQHSHIQIRPLKKRADFLRLRHAKKIDGGGVVFRKHFLIQYAPTEQQKQEPPKDDIHFGLTITKKQGNAVLRNRIRRRLRHALPDLLQKHGKSGFTYNIVAKAAIKDQEWCLLLDDLTQVLISMR